MKIHKHLLLTGLTLNPPKDPKFIEQYLVDLVDKADMEIFMEPQAKYCDDPTNAGVTGTVVITTSHASVHVWDDNGLVQIDLYSCKDFDPKAIVGFVKERFGLKVFKYEVRDRSPDDLFAELALLMETEEV